MSLTRELIEITFSNAISQASTLEECADEMEGLVRSNLSSIDSDIRGAWQGESAEAYLNKLGICGTNITENAAQLRNIAASIRRVARSFREAELRAIEIAKTV